MSGSVSYDRKFQCTELPRFQAAYQTDLHLGMVLGGGKKEGMQFFLCKNEQTNCNNATIF